jgi:hypothetical protein
MEHVVDAEPSAGYCCDPLVPLYCLPDFAIKSARVETPQGQDLRGLWNYSFSGCSYGRNQCALFARYSQTQFQF